MEPDTKKLWQSKTFWGAIITLVSAGVLTFGGTEITVEEQTTAVTSIMQIVASATAVLGTIMVIAGRVGATKQIG